MEVEVSREAEVCPVVSEWNAGRLGGPETVMLFSDTDAERYGKEQSGSFR